MVGVTKELTDRIRIQETVVKFVVDILDINDFGTQTLLAPKIRKGLNIFKKTLMCNDYVIRGVMCATQIGRRIHGNCRFSELAAVERDILDGGIFHSLRSNLR